MKFKQLHKPELDDTNKKVKSCMNMNNAEKGLLYELFVNSYINTLPDTEISWRWNDVPKQVLFDSGLITDFNKHRLAKINKNNDPNTLKDVGIDIIQKNKDNSIDFVQCKNYANALKIDDLAGFSWIMLKHSTKTGFIYHSTNKISVHIKENMIDRIKLIHKPFDNLIKDDKKVIVENVELYDYQKEIVKLYNKHYETENKAVLAMPCGTGKTGQPSCFAAS